MIKHHRRPSVFCVVTFILMTCCVAPAHAAGSGGVITLNIVDAESGNVFISGTGMPNPDGCISTAHAVTQGSNGQYHDFLALALASMATGKRAALWFVGREPVPWGSTEPVVASISMVP